MIEEGTSNEKNNCNFYDFLSDSNQLSDKSKRDKTK